MGFSGCYEELRLLSPNPLELQEAMTAQNANANVEVEGEFGSCRQLGIMFHFRPMFIDVLKSDLAMSNGRMIPEAWGIREVGDVFHDSERLAYYMRKTECI